ncbi:MAG TPA: hypothetical protein DGN59_00830 [Candidatus Latescibacteria bacterium]|nr:hypothetical protein [Candidatus Latescibacterota bacterium]
MWWFPSKSWWQDESRDSGRSTTLPLCARHIRPRCHEGGSSADPRPGAADRCLSLLLPWCGGQLLGSASITNFSLSYAVAADVRVFLMGVVANGLKRIEGMDRHSRRIVFWAIVLAVFLGMAGSVWAILEMTYRGGGVNASRWFFLHYPKIIYSTAVTTLEPAGVYWEGMGFVGIGAAAMAILTWMKSRFLWWPLHPIGFPITATRVTDQIWFSVMIAWLIKVLVLKYGGTPLFRCSRLFFLGMILGAVTVR